MHAEHPLGYHHQLGILFDAATLDGGPNLARITVLRGYGREQLTCDDPSGNRPHRHRQSDREQHDEHVGQRGARPCLPWEAEVRDCAHQDRSTACSRDHLVAGQVADAQSDSGPTEVADTLQVHPPQQMTDADSRQNSIAASLIPDAP